jgi:AmmeMemoRadiSam system radical SAM enzyme/AmmeMemoRadiSam system protein B/AmmeMemoRadiSam system protein A
MAKARVANQTLADLMDGRTVAGAPELCREEDGRIRCLACGHRCLIGEGLRGICKARFNEAGQLKVPYGYVAGLQCDPVEKKPFFHVYPGSDALTFGMLGCDLHCAYCQNWLTSQALRDASAVAPVRPVTPHQLVETAERERARLVVSSYNEPLITAEWAVGVFREAKAAGLACAFVSNGNATPEVLDFLRQWVIAYKVDLKSFSDRNYRSLGGALDNITRTIRMVHERGLWLEVVTLIIPGFNDGDDELRRAAGFLASVSPDIPWHVTAFHKDYRMTDPDATTPETLIRAAEIGTAEGLRFVYAGNLPGRVGPWEDTRCPSCRTTLIERYGFLVRSYQLISAGHCPACGARVPGVWPVAAEDVRTGNDSAAYRGRLPRRVAMDRQPADQPTRRIPLASVEAAEHMTAERAQVVIPAEERAEPPVTPAQDGLTEKQKQRVVAATAALLRATVAGQPATCSDDLGEVRSRPVAGAFVSLKRGPHLRSCCGLLGRSVPLGQALEHATARTAWEDVRFPPISPTELDYLNMEVWLLAHPEPVQALGEDRAGAIVIGKHGVQVVQGQAHGLFLPSVAVDNGWDSRRLLDQVCLKAGLPPTAWKEDITALYTFEGEVLRGRLSAMEKPPPAERRAGVCRSEDVPGYAEFCRRNLAALLAGATPDYYLWSARDGMVNGVVLLLHRPALRDTVHFSQFSLRPGLPLQGTLVALTQAAAQQLASQNITSETLDQIQIGLVLLHDPVLHGTVAVPYLDGLGPRHRAVLVLERNKAGLCYDPDRSADEVLTETAALAQVTQPQRAAVYSLDTLTNATPVRVSTAPRPARGPAVRLPAVAGKFYEADPADLARTVDRLLAGPMQAEPWPAAMVPHAGLKFSGQIVANVLKRIKIPDTVIVIGPKHTPLGVEWAVAPNETWALPGGTVAADGALARQLCQAIPGLSLDAAAHQREHAIEVELPLLARLAPRVRVVGIAIGHGDLDSCRRFADGLAGILRGRADRPLLLISSDMNHFASDAQNRRLDALALAALDRGDPEMLYETVTNHNISMCGVLPAVMVLETLRLLGALRKTERVGYATSADVTGDTSRVVGYAGMLFGA